MSVYHVPLLSLILIVFLHVFIFQKVAVNFEEQKAKKLGACHVFKPTILYKEKSVLLTPIKIQKTKKKHKKDTKNPH